MSQGLTRDEVAEGYRLFLRREPESEDAINGAIEKYADVGAYWRGLLSSDEFQRGWSRSGEANQYIMETMSKAFWALPATIEHEVSADRMDQLVARISEQWTALGEVEPHYSVLTHEDFRAEKMDEENIRRFRETGRTAASIIETFEKRSGHDPHSGVCLELGCGVGRITRFLAERFDQIIAVDISAGNLRLCTEYMQEEGVTNVTTVHISGLAELEALPEIDFFYSIIVLQHNSPPIQKAILRTLLSKIRPGGGVLFQIPTDIPGYHFSADVYLNSAEPEMEMHALPKPVVLQLLSEAGLVLSDIAPDGFIGEFGSNTFYAVKPSA
ncbi:class I SAM-dependent methyltransferase [Brevundimonas sp. NIBR11]|uniref:class I SAM-dependent methyltransferase n=1 Tax=Brevundimonas sp. NIBR11 TaxID=3015999 RepID=UPI0022F07783|nr:class I SAM-dependent methyltransferase [Brevundimonas sp. NIBR11]WGM32289.1 hypothetical protein KKHFBJBL_02540 [Brevundimonas sp. NIBR11]